MDFANKHQINEVSCRWQIIIRVQCSELYGLTNGRLIELHNYSLKEFSMCFKVLRICDLSATVDNAWRQYTEEGNRIGTDEPGDRKKGDILTDITTSFVVLIGIFFPSVTGTEENVTSSLLICILLILLLLHLLVLFPIAYSTSPPSNSLLFFFLLFILLLFP